MVTRRLVECRMQNVECVLRKYNHSTISTMNTFKSTNTKVYQTEMRRASYYMAFTPPLNYTIQ